MGRADCSFEGCMRPVNSHGLCTSHDAQRRKGRELRPIRLKQAVAAPCAVDGCGVRSSAASSGEPLCSKHYQRFTKRGTTDTPPKFRVVRVGRSAIADAVAGRDRSDCWTDWAELPCWDDLEGWGGKSTAGYPILANDMVMWLAMEADGRPRPAAPSNQGLHSCDNRACWNPSHLRWGTRSDNAQDMHRSRNYCRHCPHCNDG
jgi:hypothetical protein